MGQCMVAQLLCTMYNVLCTLCRWVRATFFLLNSILICILHSCFMIPLYPLQFIVPHLYITLESFLYSKCGEAMIAVFTCFPKLRLHSDSLSMIEPLAQKKALLVINHQDSGDVPTVMSLMAHFSNSNSSTWIMDRMFRWTPFGIPCQWHKDFFSVEGSTAEMVRSLRRHFTASYFNNGRKWIVMFPEGGYLKNRGEKARQWATRNSLPILYNCCLPRTTAFTNVIQSIRGDVCPVPDSVNHVVDVTIAYSSSSRDSPDLTFSDIVFGSYTEKDVFINFRTYPLSELPQDEGSLTNWLYDRYQEKEELLNNFKEKGVFKEDACEFKQIQPRVCSLMGTLIFWYVSAFFIFDFYWSILAQCLCFLSDTF